MKLPKSPLISLISILWWLVLIAGSFFLGRSHGIMLATPKYTIPTVQIDPNYDIPKIAVRPSSPENYISMPHFDDVYLMSKEDLEQYESFASILKSSQHRSISIDCRLLQQPIDIDLLAHAKDLELVSITLLGVREHACSITPLLQILAKSSPVKSLRIDLSGMEQLQYPLLFVDEDLLLTIPAKKLWIGHLIIGTSGNYGTGGYFWYLQSYFQNSPFDEFNIDGVGYKREGKVVIWSHFVPELDRE